jgi:hypothetical protein
MLPCGVAVRAKGHTSMVLLVGTHKPWWHASKGIEEKRRTVARRQLRGDWYPLTYSDASRGKLPWGRLPTEGYGARIPGRAMPTSATYTLTTGCATGTHITPYKWFTEPRYDGTFALCTLQLFSRVQVFRMLGMCVASGQASLRCARLSLNNHFAP